ncbi:carbon storage regulator CsrA [Cellulomonas sp. NPDC055163]
MLVLSRRVGERLLIGDDIVLTVIEVRSDGVRLGIDAPRSVRVHRAEVIEAVTAANVEASAVTDADAEALQKLVPRPPAAGAHRPATPVPASEAASSAEPHAGTERAE